VNSAEALAEAERIAAAEEAALNPEPVRMTGGGELTDKQREVRRDIMISPATHQLYYGGSRSGKTFLIIRGMVIRALKANHSTHVILRYRFNHLRASIIEQTLPAVMRSCFAPVPWKLNQSDWSVRFNNNPDSGRLLFGGLDDKERTEKILGQEHSTIHLNECSQISYSARNKVITRLAQKSGLKLRAFYDENPPNKGHWSYKMFIEKLEPLSRRPLLDADDYISVRMNPADNVKNVAPEYIRLLESLPEKDKARFLRGEFVDDVDGALWTADIIDACKIEKLNGIQLTQVVVSVDPSGCSGDEDKRSDEVGIVVAGADAGGTAYILEDATGRMGPSEWAKKAVDLYHKYKADRIIAESNFGGAMVEAVLRSADGNAPVKLITASRGKHVRAEPVSTLYTQGRVKHVGDFFDLEEQLLAFSSGGYTGDRSPDHADAAIWALTELLVPPDNSLAILHYMRDMNDASIAKTAAVAEYTWMRPPEGVGTAFGRYGAMYNINADGLIYVEYDDVEPFAKNGFTIIKQQETAQ
jgi:PBSX family phage terminase large subunit